MFFVTGLLTFLAAYFLVNGYRKNDDYQKLIGQVMIIAALGTGLILFFALTAQIN